MIDVKFRPMSNALMIRVLSVAFISGFIGLQQSEASLADIHISLLKKNYKETLRLSNELVSAQKDSVEGLYYLGLSGLYLGQYGESRRNFQKVIDLTLERYWRDRAYLGMIDSFFMDENYQDAMKTAQSLMRKSPNSDFLSLIYLKYARINLKLSNWSEAHAYLEKIIHDYPGSMEVYVAKQLLEERQYFAVQIGSFTDRKLAEKLVSAMKAQGEYAYIVETLDSNKSKYFRVRVGELSKLDEAQNLKAKLSKLGYPAQIYP